jgi:TolB-like protein
VTDSSKAVFLSYASQDAQAALQLCEALRSAGIEVWFDQSELRGGDAWDTSIRKQIKSCALFIPIISRSTHDRDEGYFRLEWKLAVDRSYLMAAGRPFLLPVVIDDTRDNDEQVPERFREVQWSRLPGGAASPAFVERVRRLLSGELSSGPGTESVAQGAGTPLTQKVTLPWWRSKAAILAAIAVVVFALGYLAANRFVPSKRGADGAAPAVAAPSAPATVAAFNPPPHSIAVLPFADMSEKKDQEYFSDGLTEELLNSLSEIDELQVAARTSAFSFKGKDTDIRTIARKLNVGAVLEGSVRRSAHTIRITAQLINAITGFHLWSKTYDRDLGDVLKLQTEIATSVASALKVTLLADIAIKVELGGTNNPAAFDAYLRGRQIGRTANTAAESQAAIAAYTEAIDVDPNYALAFAERSIEFSDYAAFSARENEVRSSADSALADARTAVVLAADLAAGHYALGMAHSHSLEFAPANEEYRRAYELAPGSAVVSVGYSRNQATMGHAAEAMVAGRRALALDPLNFNVYRGVGIAFYYIRRYPEAVTALRTSISLEPGYVRNQALLGQVYYAMGDFESARSACAVASDDLVGQLCLAKTYQKLNRHSEAVAMLQKLESGSAHESAFLYACIYAQWGDKAVALQWLERAVRRRDSGLALLKAESDLDPLRDEPRFQAVMRELKFPI